MTTTIAVLGPGKLGLSFTRHATDVGLKVRLAGRTLGHTQERLTPSLARWKASPQQETSITICGSWEEALEGADAVLEALPEHLELKAEAWSRLDKLLKQDLLRLTGTSSLSLQQIRTTAQIPLGLIGFHLFVPVHHMRIVELIREPETPKNLVARASELGKTLGLRVAQILDQPGFAASRMAIVQGLEAMRLVEQGVTSASDLDALMTQGYGHPVGPLELSDRIGLDLRLAIATQLFETTGDAKFIPPAILQQLVAAGRLGRACGQGFYRWNQEGKRL